MKKISLALLTILGIVACTPEQKKESAPALPQGTLLLDDQVTTVTWIKDNQGDKLMPRELFATAPDSLMEELSLTGGVPSS
ncbi:MAG: MBL fold metallo-hydrolase, partial [Bacteroidales bacterium]|nr:MBL fold metallo-hydrolase [Bacteroidales bacterium]